MERTQQIVRLSEFLDRHRGRILAFPGVMNVGVGPRRLTDARSEVVVQVVVRSADHAASVRAAIATLLDPQDIAVFVKGEIEPLAG